MRMFYLLFVIMLSSLAGTIVADAQTIQPMLKTMWHQENPFNNMIPQQPKAGCGPIAVSQILNYYKAPEHGFGHVTLYNDLDYTGKTIDYNNILNKYSDNYNTAQADAVANLVWQVGAAMTVKYFNGSATENNRMVWGIQKYLHISQNCRFLLRKFYTTQQWIKILDDQLKAGRPVYYRGRAFRYNGASSGYGHIFVIDGKDTRGHYHVNFGHASTTEDKFVDLNVINQSSSTYPGDYGVYYNWEQGMAIDLYYDQLFDNDTFNDYPVYLVEPLILNNNKSLSSVVVPLNESFQLYTKLQVFNSEYIKGKDGSIGVWERALGIYASNKQVAVVPPHSSPSFSTSDVTSSNLKYSLPSSLEDGKYEIRVVTRRGGERIWYPVWDVAPNTINLDIRDGLATLTTTGNHTLATKLYLLQPIREEGNTTFTIDNGNTKEEKKGKLFSLRFKNPTENNFENTIKFEIKVEGIVRATYEQNASVYSDTEVEYRFLIPNEIFDFQANSNYSIEACYYEHNENKYIKLTTDVPNLTGIKEHKSRQIDNSISVYSTNGVLLKKAESSYSEILEGLPHGCYLIKTNGETRKIIKQ